MRYSLIPVAIVTAAAATMPVGSASAAAASPVKSAALTDNPLYKAGVLPTTKCPERSLKKLDPSSARTYLNGVLSCLNRTWSTELRAAGRSFAKPKVVYTTKAPAKFCGAKWVKGAVDDYCPESRSIVFVLGKVLLEDPGDLYLFNVLAVNYSEHVQNLVGIQRAYVKLPFRTKSELAEQTRRGSLQSDCLSAAFIASVWGSLHRPKTDWDDLLYYLRDWSGTYTGSKKSITYWANQGFKSGNPGSCNTWSASSSAVA